MTLTHPKPQVSAGMIPTKGISAWWSLSSKRHEHANDGLPSPALLFDAERIVAKDITGFDGHIEKGFRVGTLQKIGRAA
jgi:hypothetical protein